jgi:hypothetical protein
MLDFGVSENNSTIHCLGLVVYCLTVEVQVSSLEFEHSFPSNSSDLDN